MLLRRIIITHPSSLSLFCSFSFLVWEDKKCVAIWGKCFMNFIWSFPICINLSIYLTLIANFPTWALNSSESQSTWKFCEFQQSCWDTCETSTLVNALHPIMWSENLYILNMQSLLLFKLSHKTMPIYVSDKPFGLQNGRAVSDLKIRNLVLLSCPRLTAHQYGSAFWSSVQVLCLW